MDATVEIPSPFLPDSNIQFAWDSTSLSYFKTCPRLYQYLMIEGWGIAEESVHLRFGIEYHQALQEYDLCKAGGETHEDALRQVLQDLLARTYDWEVNEEERAGKYKNRKSLVRSVIWYLEEHKDDPAQTYIMANSKPAVELSFRFSLDWGPTPDQPYILCGHLDKVVEFNDNLFVLDHKTTTSTLSGNWFDQWAPSNQMTLYTLASQVILGSPVKGVIINGAQLMVDGTRFVRGFTYRTQDQLDEWLGDLTTHLTLAKSYADADYWPQNDTACDKFGGCRFREVCSKSPSVREQFLKARYERLPEDKRWNPLRSRS